MFTRKKETIFLEFDQLLNLLFRGKADGGAWLWKQDPFLGAVRNFCLDASLLISRQELRDHVLCNWMLKKQNELNDEVRNSIVELLNSQLPLRN